MTGAELRAWRRRLGKDEVWIQEALDAVDVASGPHNGNGSSRRLLVEDGHREGNYGVHERDALRTAYRAALEAEEARRAAERAQAEPVCPEGVEIATSADGTYTNIRHAGRLYADGSFETLATCDDHRVALRYLLDLADYRARQHAEGDRQRKLDAVRAAEKAQQDALNALSMATRARFSAEDNHRAAQDTLARADEALRAARREAGL